MSNQASPRFVLSVGQRAVLVMLAERGRTVPLETPTLQENALKGLADLEHKGLITIAPLLGRDAKEYTLTDLGALEVDRIYASQKQSAQIDLVVEKVLGKNQ